MPSIQPKDLLHQLRSGTWDVANASSLEQIPWDEFIADLRGRYPIVFQERVVGTKHEIGMARTLQFELAVRKLPDSRFMIPCLLPVLRPCLFVSAYQGSLGEITFAKSLRVRPGEGAPGDVTLKMGRGYKLDRTPDGWVLKALEARAVTLTEVFLLKRGWRFDALLPFTS
jgi:hypothetical protein